MYSTTRISAAFALAALVHEKQKRKSTDIPYISHPMAVAAQVSVWGGSEDQFIAALLHDSGLRVKFYDRYRHSFYFILNSNLYGVSHRDLVLAAFVAQGTRKDEFNVAEWNKYKDLLKDEDLVAVMRLSVILRIAESLDRSMTGVIKSLNCDVLGDSVIMKTEVDGDATLEIKDAMGAGAEFARAFRKNLEIL